MLIKWNLLICRLCCGKWSMFTCFYVRYFLRLFKWNVILICFSPSGTALSTLPQLREYLQTAGTCKCGLPCPLRPETTFSFDPKVNENINYLKNVSLLCSHGCRWLHRRGNSSSYRNACGRRVLLFVCWEWFRINCL